MFLFVKHTATRGLSAEPLIFLRIRQRRFCANAFFFESFIILIMQIFYLLYDAHTDLEFALLYPCMARRGNNF